MTVTVCLSARTIDCADELGGHVWMYLNWATGLRAMGCRVIWLERIPPHIPASALRAKALTLKDVLSRYGLTDSLAVYSPTGYSVPREVTDICLDLDAAAEADLLLNQLYEMEPEVVARFRRSALLDSDPGLLQYWMDADFIRIAPHDVYFTIGEHLGTRCGIQWQHTHPCVALDCWPATNAATDAPFTTVSNWTVGKWVKDDEGLYRTDKRTGFAPFLDLPQHTTQPLELTLYLSAEEEDQRASLRQLGWSVRDSRAVVATPWDYQRYVQGSRGEFSCAKPSYVRMQNAWMSERTLCYLASGKPALVQHTGPSSYLPDAGGLFRFRDFGEAVNCLQTVAKDYEHQCRLAREVAEELFDARKVFGRLLDRALGQQ